MKKTTGEPSAPPLVHIVTQDELLAELVVDLLEHCFQGEAVWQCELLNRRADDGRKTPTLLILDEKDPLAHIESAGLEDAARKGDLVVVRLCGAGCRVRRQIPSEPYVLVLFKPFSTKDFYNICRKALNALAAGKTAVERNGFTAATRADFDCVGER